MKQLKKHKNIINNYKEIKQKHLEKLATKLINNEEINQKLKQKKINIDILKKF